MLLVFPSLLEALLEKVMRVDVDYAELAGIAIGISVLAMQWVRRQPGRAEKPQT
jgi:spore coat polysaccharide biosynthesis protein SpsF (cytidylyltransferase family)